MLKPVRPGDPSFQERLREIAPDCCPVTAYGALLPQSVLGIPRHGWVNLHFSVLPAWRGAAPVQHAILHGDDITGATTFQIVRELDAGPVFGVLTEPIRPTDTAGDLLDRLAASGAELLVATLDGIEDGTVRALPQSAERRQPRTEADPGGRPGGLESARAPDRPPDPRLHPGPRRLDGVRRRQDQALAGSAARRTSPAPASPLASCASSAARSTRALARARSASATCSPLASAGCPPPTGPGACTRSRRRT